MKRPAFQFYPADWRKDTALQFCSLAAQGLWINALCIAHECEPYGHLALNGKPMSSAQIGRLVGIGAKECDKLLGELMDAGVCSRADDGTVYSRRMVRDEELRNRRAAGGAAGAEYGAKGAEHGAKGGRPKREEGGLKNPPSAETRGVSEPPIKPPPSSSSSASAEVSDGANAPSSSPAEPTTDLAGPKPAKPGGPPEIPPPYGAIVDAYHEVLPEMPKVLLRTGKTWVKRQRAMDERWRFALTSTRSNGQRRATNGAEALAWIREFFTRTRANDWLMGRTPPGKGHEGWRCDFDFLLSEAGLKAVVERTEVAA